MHSRDEADGQMETDYSVLTSATKVQKTKLPTMKDYPSIRSGRNQNGSQVNLSNEDEFRIEEQPNLE